MTMLLNLILFGVAAYLLVGLVFGVAFVARGIARVDPVAAGSSWGVRLVVLPGVAALWPVMAARWLQAVRTAGAKA